LAEAAPLLLHLADDALSLLDLERPGLEEGAEECGDLVPFRILDGVDAAYPAPAPLDRADLLAVAGVDVELVENKAEGPPELEHHFAGGEIADAHPERTHRSEKHAPDERAQAGAGLLHLEDGNLRLIEDVVRVAKLEGEQDLEPLLPLAYGQPLVALETR